jgi:predicted Rossmann-fold nucleotide-binding protein
LGLHARPVVLVDVEAYWRPFLDLLQHQIRHGFADESFLGFLTLVPDAVSGVDKIEKLLG